MERRHEHRHPYTCDVVSSLDPRALRGTVVNLSVGGACVISAGSVERFVLLPCGFRFPDVPVPVPVLAQVRWVQPVPSEENTFRVGLLFIA